jgi:hypothetical protein
LLLPRLSIRGVLQQPSPTAAFEALLLEERGGIATTCQLCGQRRKMVNNKKENMVKKKNI